MILAVLIMAVFGDYGAAGLIPPPPDWKAIAGVNPLLWLDAGGRAYSDAAGTVPTSTAPRSLGSMVGDPLAVAASAGSIADGALVFDGSHGPFTATVPSFNLQDHVVFLISRFDRRTYGNLFGYDDALNYYCTLKSSWYSWRSGGHECLDPWYGVTEGRQILTFVSRTGGCFVRQNGVQVVAGDPHTDRNVTAFQAFGYDGFPAADLLGAGWAILLFPAGLSNGQIAAVESALSAIYPSAGDPAVSLPAVFVDGNSISFGYECSRNSLSFPARLGYARLNIAYPGMTGDTMVARAAAAIDPHRNPSRARSVLIVSELVNSIRVGFTGVQAADQLLTYRDERVSAGWDRIILWTCAGGAWSAGGYQTQRVACNARLLAQYPTVVAPYTYRASDGTLLVDIAAAVDWDDETNTVDGLHWSDAGHGLAAAAFAPAVAGAMA